MFESMKDFITGKEIDNVGSEASRQIFEKFLVETKGFRKEEIFVDAPLIVQFKGEDYVSAIDLIVCCDDKPFMAVTCVAGSIGSYEREILAGARLIYEFQIPFAVSTDARNAVVMDTISGKTISQGLDAIPTREAAKKNLASLKDTPYNPEKRKLEMIIYRSFNMEKINR
ncbi:MAG: type I restriction enzyme HsdR N-terminal domain-containing protein [Desulfobacteraceae bacterium]|nr:type I restriction enzyme HsdR N-terminal domain-containing protein [Desulfobacteraceae bacterium]